jgi:glycosyltransferase involved in cell wall biosynthesis
VHFQGPWSAESGIEGDGLLATRAKHWTESQVYKRAARLIVLSRAFARLLEERYDVPADRIRVIPGAVNTRRFLPTRSRGDARRALGWPTDRPIVLVVRRLVRRMGLENLLAAVRLAKVSVPDVLVIIAGTGPLSGELQQRAQAEGLSSNVRFTGFLPEDDLPSAYRAADLSVVPSVALEGFGLIVAESLAAGTPALVTNVGGLPETIERLAPQCIVHDAGARPLAAMLVDALRGTLPLPPLAECIQHAQAHFDWSVVTGRVRDTYLEAVS